MKNLNRQLWLFSFYSFDFSTRLEAIAEFFGLRYETDENDKTQFNHSLRTIVITPEGKVQKVFSGNEWTTGDLLRELQATTK